MILSNRKITSIFFRLILGFTYLSAGFSKLAPDHIGNVIGPSHIPDDIFSIVALSLFYVLAILQIIAGGLTISLRYAGAGLLLLLPLTASILIFTIVAGFGATPLINLIFLFMVAFEIRMEYQAWKVDDCKASLFKYLMSKFDHQYPKEIVIISILLLAISLITTPFQSIHLNIMLSVAVGLVAAMLLRLSNLAVIDKALIILFTLFSLSVINGIYLKELDPSFFYKALLILPVGAITGLSRMIWYHVVLHKRK